MNNTFSTNSFVPTSVRQFGEQGNHDGLQQHHQHHQQQLMNFNNIGLFSPNLNTVAPIINNIKHNPYTNPSPPQQQTISAESHPHNRDHHHQLNQQDDATVQICPRCTHNIGNMGVHASKHTLYDNPSTVLRCHPCQLGFLTHKGWASHCALIHNTGPIPITTKEFGFKGMMSMSAGDGTIGGIMGHGNNNYLGQGLGGMGNSGGSGSNSALQTLISHNSKRQSTTPPLLLGPPSNSIVKNLRGTPQGQYGIGVGKMNLTTNPYHHQHQHPQQHQFGQLHNSSQLPAQSHTITKPKKGRPRKVLVEEGNKNEDEDYVDGGGMGWNGMGGGVGGDYNGSQNGNHHHNHHHNEFDSKNNLSHLPSLGPRLTTSASGLVKSTPNPSIGSKLNGVGVGAIQSYGHNHNNMSNHNNNMYNHTTIATTIASSKPKRLTKPSILLDGYSDESDYERKGPVRNRKGVGGGSGIGGKKTTSTTVSRSSSHHSIITNDDNDDDLYDEYVPPTQASRARAIVATGMSSSSSSSSLKSTPSTATTSNPHHHHSNSSHKKASKKPNQSCERCGFVYAHPATRAPHRNSHENWDKQDSSVYKFSCSTCELSWTGRESLITHLDSQMCSEGLGGDYSELIEARETQCTRCGFYYNGAHSCAQHARLHANYDTGDTKKYPYQCGTCQISWTIQGGLKKHLDMQLCVEGRNYYENNEDNIHHFDKYNAEQECGRCGLKLGLASGSQHPKLHQNYDKTGNKRMAARCDCCELAWTSSSGLIKHYQSMICADGHRKCANGEVQCPAGVATSVVVVVGGDNNNNSLSAAAGINVTAGTNGTGNDVVNNNVNNNQSQINNNNISTNINNNTSISVNNATCQRCHLQYAVSGGEMPHNQLHANFDKVGDGYNPWRCEKCNLAWLGRAAFANHTRSKICIGCNDGDGEDGDGGDLDYDDDNDQVDGDGGEGN